MEKFKCNLCDGKGERYIVTKYSDNGQYRELKSCEKCGGEGKLDWVEMVTGKSNVKVYTSSITFNSNPGWD